MLQPHGESSAQFTTATPLPPPSPPQPMLKLSLCLPLFVLLSLALLLLYFFLFLPLLILLHIFHPSLWYGNMYGNTLQHYLYGSIIYFVVFVKKANKSMMNAGFSHVTGDIKDIFG
jgi:hypothetical protein